MSRLSRALQTLFAGSVTPANNIAQFASTVTGTPNYTNNPATIQALSAWQNSGLYASLINSGGGKNSPVFQELNAILFLAFRQIQYGFQLGVAEWIATETYYIGSIAQDGAGNPYVSQTDANINNALSDTNNWLPLGTTMKGAGMCKAWATIDGATGTFFKSFNISGFTRVSTGIYQLTVPSGVLADNFYSVVGTCGTPNGIAPIAGDQFTISTGYAGQTGVHTQTLFRVYCSNQNTGALADSSMISLQLFGN